MSIINFPLKTNYDVTLQTDNILTTLQIKQLDHPHFTYPSKHLNI